MKSLNLPMDQETLEALRVGDEVLLNGILYVGRDQAHKRFIEYFDNGKELPVDLKGQVIYYMGPTPTPPDRVIGSAGPTTASRMDPFTPRMLDYGLKGMIGKGPRSRDVIDACKKYKAVYFYAFGGCGALYAEKIKSCECLAFTELGPEAVYQLTVEAFPVIVGVDSLGQSIY